MATWVGSVARTSASLVNGSAVLQTAKNALQSTQPIPVMTSFSPQKAGCRSYTKVDLSTNYSLSPVPSVNPQTQKGGLNGVYSPENSYTFKSRTFSSGTELRAGGSVLESASPDSEGAQLEGEKSASSSDKISRPKHVLVAAAKVTPHPAKVEKGGEDAHFIGDQGGGVLVVADGVGGWAEDGVDPALYSREFVQHAEASLQYPQTRANPQMVLHYAHRATASPGAATAVAAMVTAGEEDSKETYLRIANVGDSGVRLVRNGKVVFATPALQHFFDCPLQFGLQSTDSANDAQLFELEVKEGDTIVMGSDGLYDNVFDRDIGAAVALFGGADASAAQRTAGALAALASKHAGDPTYDSPYAIEARSQGVEVPIWKKLLGRKFTGGKLDDITVVVAHVVPASDAK